ncbi:MAG: peptidoglycan-binding protein [Scytolyngbya sp. HA4215-MV1]|nr:peptidoglycan-binding protein [Scytolyngbya sp. HA4215-MV1]
MHTNPEFTHEGEESALSGPVLHPWDRKPAVAELQELLNAHGFKMRIDGDFGFITEAAVKSLQRQHQLRIDGIVRPRLWMILKTTIQAGSRVLKQGHTGADVNQLQGLLQINGYQVPRNGIFCAQTHEAILDFQQSCKLKVDGKVDQITWLLLRGKPTSLEPRKQTRWFLQTGKWW